MSRENRQTTDNNVSCSNPSQVSHFKVFGFGLVFNTRVTWRGPNPRPCYRAAVSLVQSNDNLIHDKAYYYY